MDVQTYYSHIHELNHQVGWLPGTSDRTEKFSALMIIDLITNLVEIVRVNNKTTSAITAHFVNVWLACDIMCT
jgi:hypothetical protein